jgi:hypothetical protein
MTIAIDIAPASPTEPPLNLIHTTAVSAFRNICKDRLVRSRLCPVMGKELTYLFYGRPAYRPGNIDRTNVDQDTRPVCMLFRMAAIGPISAVYPFDTGAHYHGLYSPYMDGIAFADLECSSIDASAQRIVGRYFGTNIDYLYGEARAILDPLPASDIAKAYHALLVTAEERRHDDRCATIEIQLSDNLSLDIALCP